MEIDSSYQSSGGDDSLTPEPEVTHEHQELSPLFNELTLNKILCNLPLPMLLKCRLVCKTWSSNTEITRRISEKVTIGLNSYHILDEFLHFLNAWNSTLGPLNLKRFNLHFTAQCHPLCDSSHALSEREEAEAALGKGKLSQLFQKIKNSSSWLHVNFLQMTLDKTHLDKDGLESLLLSNPSINNHLNTLHIYNLSHRVVFSQGFIPSTTSGIQIKLLQNLRKLIMDEIRIAIPEFMSDFLSHCGNLEEIVLKCDKRSDWENQKGIWKEHSPLATSFIKGLVQCCEIDGNNNKPFKLRVIRCGILDLTHFLLLTKLGSSGSLRLSHLEIYCPAKDVSSEVLKDFLQTQTCSLRILRVLGNVDKLRRAVGNNNGNQKDISPEFVLQLPDKMDVLQEFQLSGRDKDTPLPIMPFRYGIQFPRLTTLIVYGFATNIDERRMEDYFPSIWRRDQKPCYTLNKLVLPAEIRDPGFPPRIAQLFPNVTDLEIKYPDSSFLVALFTSFQKIERLKILAESGVAIDQGIMGRGIEEDGIDHGIMRLTRLRILEITVETEHREVPTALTDQVCTTLIKMKNLRKLMLKSCCWFDGPLPCNFLSQKCKAELVKELESCVVIFSPLGKTCCPERSSEPVVAEFYGS